MSLLAIRAMVRKDLRLFFSDRRALIISFAAPMAIGSFFGSVFRSSGSDGEVAKVPVMIVDQDHSAISTAIIRSAEGDKTIAVVLTTEDSARDEVKRGKTTVAIVIPAGFGDAAAQAFFNGRDKPRLQFLYDPSHSAEKAMVGGVLTQHVMQAVSGQVFGGGTSGNRYVDQALQSLDSNGMADSQAAALRGMLNSVRNYNNTAQADTGKVTAPGFSMPYEVQETAVTSGEAMQYNGYAHAFGGMGVQFLLFAAIDLAIGILLDRQRGLWKRLRSAPVSRFTLLGGKLASGTIITLMTLLASFAFAIIVFGVRIGGSVPGFFLVALATALMATSFGLLLAAIGNNMSSTRGIATFAVLMMVMLGGAWMPSFLFPAWLQKASVVIPVKWAVDGLDAMTWRGLPFSAAVLPVGMLLGFALLFSAVTLWRFRWEEA